MNGYELVIPYLIADRQARAEADRLARLVSKRSKGEEPDDVEGGSRDVAPDSWIPVIFRGWPSNQEVGR